MKVNLALIILLIFIITVCVLFCTFFSARLAQLKGRKKAWGMLGFFFSFIGLLTVCFLPSKRKDNIETNPIKHAFSKMPSPSRKTIGMLVGIFFAVIITVIAYDNIPAMIENYKYSKEVTSEKINEDGQPKLIDTTVNDIFVGTESTFAVSESGDVYCWGKQHASQLKNESRGVIYKNAKKALSNENITLILTNDNKLYGTGKNVHGFLPIETETTVEFVFISDNVTDFDLSETTIGIIKENQNLYMYGNNAYGQLGTGNTKFETKPVLVLKKVKQVCCEATFTVALKTSGEVYAFGNNHYNQFGIDGKIITEPRKIYNGILQAAAGDDFILLLKENSELVACGFNSHGQLGNSTTENLALFTFVLKEVKSIGAAKNSAYAILTNDELYTWGLNTVGQLGSGTQTDIAVPTLALSNVKTAAISGLHMVAITNDGEIVSTGYDNCGQLGRGQSRNKFSSLVSIK